MSKPKRALYRTTNWSACNAALRKRGSLLIWLDKETAWHAPHEGRPGRPPVFSNAAIQFCLSVKVLFKLPLRQTAGMVASLLQLAGLDWPDPDYSTLCRRQKTLRVQIPCRRAEGPLKLLVDSTVIKFLGDGEWQARKHGVQGRRQWRKVHLAMDTATSDIRAVEFTPSREGDSPVLPGLLDQIPDDEDIGTVTADGAYDTRSCHSAIIRTRWHGDHPDPQERAALARGLSGRGRPQHDPPGRSRRRPRRMEAAERLSRQEQGRGKMRCLKSFGERIAARDPRPPDRRNRGELRVALTTASMPSAPPKSSAWPEPEGERGSHVWMPPVVQGAI